METSPLTIPDYKNYQDFKNWVLELPNIESPAWSGLPLNVEKLNRIRRAGALVTEIKMIQDTDDDLQGASQNAAADGTAQWLVALEQKITLYSNLLPS